MANGGSWELKIEEEEEEEGGEFGGVLRMWVQILVQRFGMGEKAQCTRVRQHWRVAVVGATGREGRGGS